MPVKFYTILFHLFLILCLPAQAGNKIEIIQADYLKGNKAIDPGLRKLIGNVILRHNITLMYCDSAYFYPADNIFEAFHNIKVLQGDSVSLYCDFLRFDGNIDLAKATKNVKLIDKKMTLYTHSLDFNTAFSVGNYYNGGKIINGETVLTSKRGTYNSNIKEFRFKDSVVVKDPQYQVFSDTLHYLSEIEKVYFFGPTTILLDTNTIYCEFGWYEAKDSIAEFRKNAFIKNNSQFTKGDLLYYNQTTKAGYGRRNVEIIDYKRDVIVRGHKADFDRKTELYTVTDSALLILITEGDSIFIHADTLCSIIDTSNNKRILKAYHRVKFYRTDIQGKCDSMVYTSIDSVIRLYKDPVIWSGENQITANRIEVYIKNKTFDRIKMEEMAFIVSIEDSSKYNQIKGKNMIGYFKDRKLYKIDVFGNGQSVYFPRENEKYIGINKVESSDMVLYIEDRKIKKINCIKTPTARLIPLKDATPEDYQLKGFNWFGHLRPYTKDEIFK